MVGTCSTPSALTRNHTSNRAARREREDRLGELLVEAPLVLVSTRRAAAAAIVSTASRERPAEAPPAASLGGGRPGRRPTSTPVRRLAEEAGERLGAAATPVSGRPSSALVGPPREARRGDARCSGGPTRPASSLVSEVAGRVDGVEARARSRARSRSRRVVDTAAVAEQPHARRRRARQRRARLPSRASAGPKSGWRDRQLRAGRRCRSDPAERDRTARARR